MDTTGSINAGLAHVGEHAQAKPAEENGGPAIAATIAALANNANANVEFEAGHAPVPDEYGWIALPIIEVDHDRGGPIQLERFERRWRFLVYKLWFIKSLRRSWGNTGNFLNEFKQEARLVSEAMQQ